MPPTFESLTMALQPVPSFPDNTIENPALAPQAERLSALPNWFYLLREFYEMHRSLSSGGSSKIRAHQRGVRETISKVMKSNAEVRLGPRTELPVLAHFQRALDQGRKDRLSGVVRAVDAVRDGFSWQYGYDKVPRGLVNKFAYCELCGPNGPVVSPDVILGLVLFAPGCTYPAHAHHGITESYICLSGAVSENHQGVYSAGSMIFNPPEQLHRITVSDREPALMAYAWMGSQADLAEQKMVFTRKRLVKG